MARRGRKTELAPSEKLARVTLTLDERTVRLLRILGQGNASRGARKASEVAYARYLREI